MELNITELLKILACPACHSDLQFCTGKDHQDGFICQACSKVYPIRDNIPIMLIEEAIPLHEWQNNSSGE